VVCRSVPAAANQCFGPCPLSYSVGEQLYLNGLAIQFGAKCQACQCPQYDTRGLSTPISQTGRPIEAKGKACLPAAPLLLPDTCSLTKTSCIKPDCCAMQASCRCKRKGRAAMCNAGAPNANRCGSTNQTGRQQLQASGAQLALPAMHATLKLFCWLEEGLTKGLCTPFSCTSTC
jgi:hypothetical protein